MKLLFRASKRGGTNTTNPEYVKINKTVIVIGEMVSKRLTNKDYNVLTLTKV